MSPSFSGYTNTLYPYYITEPISEDFSNLDIIIEGNGSNIVTLSNFSTPNYILTLTGNTSQFNYYISKVVFFGMGTGNGANVSGLQIVNGGTGIEYGLFFKQLITGKYYAIGTLSGQALQVDGFTSIMPMYTSVITGIINQYGGVTEINPQFTNVAGTCIIDQTDNGTAFGNVEIINPFIYSDDGVTPPPVLLEINEYDAKNIYFSNIMYWMIDGVAGTTYTLINTNINSGSYPPHPINIEGLETFGTGNLTLVNQNNISGTPINLISISKALFAHNGSLQLKSGSGTTQLTIRDSYITVDSGSGKFVTGIVASDATLIANLFNVLGYTTLLPITTPTIPTSGTAQENTNPYAVNVYLYGGTVTEIQITRNGTAYTVFSNASGLALSGQVYKLNPTDSITITYTTAPTWEWLSD